jgi:uncharacterized protein (TIRG00374 family)
LKQFFSHPVVVNIAKVIISAVLLIGLLYYIDTDSIVTSFANADNTFLIAGFALAALQLVIHFYRWRYLLRLVSREISDREAFTSFFVGFMAGFFTPAQIGEFAGRIASHPSVKKSHIVGITLIDKMYWAALTFVIGGSGIVIFIAEQYPEYWNPLYRYVVTFILGLIIAPFIYPEKVKEVLTLLPEKVRNHRFYEIILVIEEVFHNRNAWMLFTMTGALYGVILLEYYFLVNAFGPVTLNNAVMCGASVFFVKSFIFPISFGDLGVRESAAVYFFVATGTAAAVAFNASIVMSFANVIIPTAIGALLVATLKRK